MSPPTGWKLSPDNPLAESSRLLGELPLLLNSSLTALALSPLSSPASICRQLPSCVEIRTFFYLTSHSCRFSHYWALHSCFMLPWWLWLWKDCVKLPVEVFLVWSQKCFYQKCLVILTQKCWLSAEVTFSPKSLNHEDFLFRIISNKLLQWIFLL